MLAERAGCGVRAADPQFRIGPDGLDGGELLVWARLSLEVIETPGHTSDSRSLLLSGPDGVSRLITGDMVLGRGTTVITYPDGDLAAYFESLDLLEQAGDHLRRRRAVPGHGPIVTDPLRVVVLLSRHRQERLDQIRAALAAGDRSAGEIVARVYADVDRSVWPAAEQSVRAQLDYLREHELEQDTVAGCALLGRWELLSELIPASQDAHRVPRNLEAMNPNQQPGIPDFTTQASAPAPG